MRTGTHTTTTTKMSNNSNSCCEEEQPSKPSVASPITDTNTNGLQNKVNSMPSGCGSSELDEQIERLKRCEYLRESEVKVLLIQSFSQYNDCYSLNRNVVLMSRLSLSDLGTVFACS